jgi:hypothetical protein
MKILIRRRRQGCHSDTMIVPRNSVSRSNGILSFTNGEMVMPLFEVVRDVDDMTELSSCWITSVAVAKQIDETKGDF